MNSVEFTYRLQGFFEISDAKKLDEKQVQIIKDHLALVFNKVTPNRNEVQKQDLPQDSINDSFEFKLPNLYCSTSTASVSSGINPDLTRVIC